ncbi:uncharacterized protein LOC143339295 [Chaetodon auriga]|uniref:uncharacterized protein LOC143339295 n=1 Tax=Chaetodon auriga TaxID=39042 RepID=UPI004032A6D7
MPCQNQHQLFLKAKTQSLHLSQHLNQWSPRLTQHQRQHQIFKASYVTGSAVPEQKGAEAEVLFGIDSTSEGDAAPANTKPLKIKAVPETVAAKSTESITPEEALAVGVPEVAPEEASIKSQPEAGPDRVGVKGLPAGETGATENLGGASISKGQGAKPAKPDCGPSGLPNGQWMKIPRPGYNAGASASSGTNTKGYGAGAGAPKGYGAKPNRFGASAGGQSNGGGAKANKPGYGAGGYTVPGLSNGYGAGLGYPYAGKPQQPGYGQGAYLGAGYGNRNSYGGITGLGEASKSKSGYGNGNGYSAGVQPDYASLGQGAAAANGKSGGARQIPYNGAPVVPAGLDGMGSLPFGGQPLGMGAEKSNAKYGYGGSPYGPAGDNKSSGKYGGLGASMGGDPAPGKYGQCYGRMPYEAQPAGLAPEAKSTGKYDNQGSYQPQPLESASEARSGGEYDTAGLPYEPLPLEPESAGKSYVKGEVPTPAIAVESDEMSIDRYENVGYINGQVQPEVVAFPAAPTPSPTLAYPSVPSYLPMESSYTPDVVPGAGVEDLPDPAGTAGLGFDSAAATGTHDEAQVPEQADDLLQQQQLPRQIHIQQHLKLHFHPQGAKNSKYDLNGFFGNSGYQG